MTAPNKILFLFLLLLLSQPAFCADKPEPCDISFDSMSVKEGETGDTFLMLGQWGTEQGEKLPAINQAKLEPLEVVSWSERQLTVRIPTSLSPGLHKVGVYCRDPRKGATYATDWKFFTVKAKSTAEPGIRREPLSSATGEPDVPVSESSSIGDPLEAYEKDSGSFFWIAFGIILIAGYLWYSRRSP